MPEAEAELLAERDRYNGERPGLGDELVDEIEQLTAQIVMSPKAFAVVPRSPAHRRAFERRFKLSVVYEIEGDEIHVVAIAPQRPRPEYWSNRSRS